MPMTSDEMAGAEISECGKYRYRLWRRWGRGPQVLWIMLNTSTADALADDPTIRRCAGFTRAWGCDGFEVVNLYAFRAAIPRVLASREDPHGPHLWTGLDAALNQEWRHVVAAWGATAPVPRSEVEIQVDYVTALRSDLECLGITNAGHPRHPLYVPRSQHLEPWKPTS